MTPVKLVQSVALNDDGQSIRFFANALGSTVFNSLQRFKET